jgi:hypothetical protein
MISSLPPLSFSYKKQIDNQLKDDFSQLSFYYVKWQGITTPNYSSSQFAEGSPDQQ